MHKRKPRFTKRFDRNYRKLHRSGRSSIEKLDTVMRLLIRKEPLLPSHHDHALHGEWQGCRDCHIEGDWILVYELGLDGDGQETITFHATGNHEYLFG